MQSRSNQTPEGILHNGRMVDGTVNAGRSTEEDRAESGEWRVERGEGQRRTERKRRWPKAWELLRRHDQNQRTRGCPVGEVVMEERASGRNRLRGQALGP
jgi:hypothetical protein